MFTVGDPRLVDDSSDLGGDEALLEGSSKTPLPDFDRVRRRVSLCNLVSTLRRTDI